jgi:hypothetical protein
MRCTTSGIPAYSAVKQCHATHISCAQHAASDKKYGHPFFAAIQETGSYIDLFSLQGEKGQM